MKRLLPSTLLVPLLTVFLGTTALCEPAADPGPAPTAEELKSYTALAQKGVLVQPLAAGINWRYVNFRGAEKVDASVFALLKGAVTTVDLDLTGQKLTDADAAALSTLTNLKKLSLARSTITDAGLAACNRFHSASNRCDSDSTRRCGERSRNNDRTSLNR